MWKYKLYSTRLFFSSINSFLKKSWLIASIVVTSIILIVAIATPIIATFSTTLRHRHFLEDFDFMIATMEENFPFFGVYYRMYGVDLLEFASEIRQELEVHPGLTGEEFFRILRRFANHRWGFAHLDILTFSDALTWGAIEDPNVRGERSRFAPVSVPVSRGAHLVGRDIIETEIIEEGRIAYINFPSFSWGWDWSRQGAMELEALRFIDTLQGYEHLIVDIRGTYGGWHSGFVNSIIRPHIDEVFVDEFFAFHTGGSHANLASIAKGSFGFGGIRDLGRTHTTHQLLQFTARRFSEAAHFTNEFVESIIDIEHNPFTPATEIVEWYNLVYMNLDDLSNLAYGHHLTTRITPRTVRHPFDGQIWLLVSPGNVSTSEAAARLAKDTGVAILVGQTTGGAIGGGATSHIRLPNTSLVLRWDTIYITDRYGRALEEYRTTPHFENRPGLDALATVLELIEEGIGY